MSEKLPNADDLFNGSDRVLAIVELPSEIYDGLHRAYEKGCEQQIFELTEGQWLGGFICDALKKQFVETSSPPVANFGFHDQMLKWVQGQIQFHEACQVEAMMKGSGSTTEAAKIDAYRKVLDKILGFGRI